MEPKMTLDEAKATVATKVAPRVTEDSIKARIAGVEHIRHEHLTICIITMQNDFFVVGISAPASKQNYDREVGERYAYENAFKQLWQLEGYLLRELIHNGFISEAAPSKS
jgi:hypothetical protein